MPQNYPTNQAFISTDGSVWLFNNSTGQWSNVGIPPGSGLLPPTGASTATTSTDSSGSPAPVSVNVSPGGSGWQSILDWLTQATLISPIPNWIPAAGVGLLAFKFMGGKR